MSKNNKNKNQKKGNNTKKVKLSEEALLRAEKEGLISGNSGLKQLVIHDQTRHRTFTDAGRMARARTREGNRMDFECYVKRRTTVGPVEAALMLRSIASILDRETVIKILTESPEFIVNPEMTLAVVRQLMEDGMISQSMADEIIDEKHPAWSQLPWKEDTALQADFVESFLMEEDNKGLTAEDANKAFLALPHDLVRKEGKVKVSIRNDGGKRDYEIHIACERVTLDKGRYFLALAKNCSPFRIAWLRLHGWRNKQRQIEGRPTDHRAVYRTTPSYVKDDKSQLTLGDAIMSQSPGATSIFDALKSGETLTL